MSEILNNSEEEGAWGVTYDGESLDDIIDISLLNFDDNQTWLMSLGERRPSASVDDLHAWLKHDLESITDITSKKSIDTRTFTRPKKKFGRMSFESITEVTSPPGNNNPWKPEMPIENSHDSSDEKWQEQKEYIPAMLRPSLPGSNNNCLPPSTGQESLDAFLNMSQSNGIDSFINLTPDFNDSTIMNTSKPSFLEITTTIPTGNEDKNSSKYIANEMTYSQINDDSSADFSITDSQILTNSMMQTSIFSNISDSHCSDPFSKDFLDNSVVANQLINTFDAKTPTPFDSNNTFTSESSNVLTKKNNETFTESLDVCEKYNETLDVFTKKSNETFTSNELQDVFTKKNNDTFTSNEIQDVLLKTNNETFTSNEMQDVLSKTNNVTFTSNEMQDIFTKKNNETFTSNEMQDVLSNQPQNNHESFVINRTFDADLPNHLSYIVTTESDSYFEEENREIIDKRTSLSGNLTYNYDKNEDENNQSVNTTYNAKTSPRNSTYSANNNTNQHNLSDDKMTTIFENSSEIKSPIKPQLNTTFKSPLAQRNHMPKSLNSTFSNEPPQLIDDTSKKLDETYDQNNFKPPPPSMPINRYQTYRKNPTINKIKPTNFKKPGLPFYNENQGRSLENLNTDVKKPISRQLPSKLNGPKTLSRLPQSFQKSNPNLLSHQAGTDARRLTSFGFNRQSKLVNSEQSSLLTSKLQPLLKGKCGSEQRVERPGYLACGSTESIASTRSAPDLDDRLSECSDSSQASGDNCRRTITINEIKCIDGNGMRKLGYGSTPKPERNVLENNWMVEENELPSPIMKAEGNLGSRGSSPASGDSTVKTSSPLLSPAESLQSFPINSGNHVSNNKDIRPLPKSPEKKPEVPVQAIKKSGLRLPSTRPLTAASGIPRPASRIPAPRFSRPAATTKSSLQSVAKKSIL